MRRIAVIGSGVAGLAAAWRLTRPGVPLQVSPETLDVLAAWAIVVGRTGHDRLDVVNELVANEPNGAAREPGQGSGTCADARQIGRAHV